MNNDIKRLPASELEVMLAIWSSKVALHTGEIAQVLGREKNRPIQAIQTMLIRLGEKGFVRAEKIGRLNYYHSLVRQDDYRELETESFIEKLYDSSPIKLVAALVQNARISDEDIAEIKRILEHGGTK